MTKQDARTQMHNLGALFGQRVKIWLISGFLWVMTWLSVSLFTPLGDRALSIWNSPAQLVEIQATLDRMATQVARASGEDRVIRQPQGLSYVTEPVFRGDAVVMFMTAARTNLGADCRLMDWTPLFTDSSNITTPGQKSPTGRTLRQLTVQLAKQRIEIVPPPNLALGRIELYLAMEYQCNDKTVPERTDVVTYELRARPAQP